MGLPDETSWECEECSSFNIRDGIILEGHMYCKDCVEKSKNEARSLTKRWRI